MADDPTIDLLAGLASTNPDTAWKDFLRRYSASLMRVVQRFEKNPDRASDCFEYVCSALSDDRFNRLRRFTADGPATFHTWLLAITANLCIDWQRKRRGRLRPVRAVADLPELDRLVYQYIYARGLSRTECFRVLVPKFPYLSEHQVGEINARLFALLGPRQRWQLSLRRMAEGVPVAALSLESAEGAFQIEDPLPGPAEVAEADQQSVQMTHALAQLPSQLRLLLRLRYQENLTLVEVARLTGLADPFRADRQIKAALAALQKLLGEPE